MKSYRHYIVCLFLVILSGNYPVMKLFNLFEKDTITLFVFLIITIYYKKKLDITNTLSSDYYIISVCFVLVYVFQILVGLNPGAGSIVRPLCIITIPAILYAMSPEVSMSFEISKIIISLIKLSFIFWIPAAILLALHSNILDFIPDALLFTGDDATKTHIILHCFKSNVFIQEGALFLRNCGMFWEPGGFAGIIGFGWLHFASVRDLVSVKLKNKMVIWFILGMISTQSSTGLIAIPFLLLITYTPMNNSAYVISRGILVIPFIIILSIFLFKVVPQVGDKVLGEFSYVDSKDGHWQDTRYGTIIILSEIIVKNPLTGLSFNSDYINNEVLSLVDTEDVGAMGNGMFVFIAQMGIPLMILFFVICYRSQFFNFKGSYIHALLSMIILILFLQGELWMNFMIIYTFIFKDKREEVVQEKRAYPAFAISN